MNMKKYFLAIIIFQLVILSNYSFGQNMEARILQMNKVRDSLISTGLYDYVSSFNYSNNEINPLFPYFLYTIEKDKSSITGFTKNYKIYSIKKEQFISDKVYTGLFELKHGCAIVFKGEVQHHFLDNSHWSTPGKGKYGMIDTSGNFIIPFEFDTIWRRSVYHDDNEIFVRKGDKYGMYNTEGKLLIPVQYAKINLVSNNLAIVKDKGYYGVVKYYNKTLISIDYDEITNVGNCNSEGIDSNQYVKYYADRLSFIAKKENVYTLFNCIGDTLF